MPIVIVISAFIFNLFNGFFVGYEIGNISQIDFGINTFIGLTIFFIGMYINRSSDNKLISLRRENKEYQIPQGGMFDYISCPNHFGEIVEWIGFTVIVFNLGTLSFALWTSFNLIPRALNHHNWYINHFKEYPVKRKAIIPFIIWIFRPKDLIKKKSDFKNITYICPHWKVNSSLAQLVRASDC